MSEMGWVGTGVQRIDPGMVPADRWDREMAYAVRSQTHLWNVVVSQKVSVEALEKMHEEPLHLDRESMLTMPMVGCLVCEQEYEPRLLRRKCPGEPKA